MAKNMASGLDNAQYVQPPSTSTTPDVVIGKPAQTPGAPAGLLHIASGAGAPTAAPPLLTGGGAVPLYYDTTNHKLWIYDGGWKGVVVA